jgi:2'-5' RNA ligase
MTRLFIALEFAEDIKDDILRIQKKLPAFNGKLTEFENLHLTLKFLGEVDNKTAVEIKKRLKKLKLKSFKIKIDSVGIFADRIIWIGIKNCEGLQGEIDEALKDLFKKEEKFMGHLTIARARGIKDKRKFYGDLMKIRLTPIEVLIDKFYLKQSTLTKDKPLYETVEEYPLKD